MHLFKKGEMELFILFLTLQLNQNEKFFNVSQSNFFPFISPTPLHAKQKRSERGVIRSLAIFTRTVVE